MKIAAFSCAHLCSPDTQRDLHDMQIDYGPLIAMLMDLVEDPPDYVVNLGDFVEPMYDSPEIMEELIEKVIPWYRMLQDVTEVIEVNGNHDYRHDRANQAVVDDITFEHGHQLFRPMGFESRTEYVALLRETTQNLQYKLCHGHTHYPHTMGSGWPLDVGSISFSRTYGIIEDGKPRLVML